MTSDISPPWPPLSPVLVNLTTGLAIRGESGDLAVYRFVPYEKAVMAKDRKLPVVPWATDWPSYLKDTIAHYAPLPRATSEIPAIARELGYQERKDGKKPVEQAVYRGWPLYVFDLDQTDSPASGRVPGFFELVTPDVPYLADGDIEEWPNTWGGP